MKVVNSSNLYKSLSVSRPLLIGHSYSDDMFISRKQINNKK